MRVAVIGSNKSIKEALERCGHETFCYGRNSEPAIDFLDSNFPVVFESEIRNKNIDTMIVLAGILYNKDILEQTVEESVNSFKINLMGPVICSEILLQENPEGRVILVGSESGEKGSFDTVYATLKAGLRMYTLERRVGREQQILMLSPSTIEDFGMTCRRADKERLELNRRSHPKERFLGGDEFIDCVIRLLEMTCYLTNEEVRLNGGKFARMVKEHSRVD